MKKLVFTIFNAALILNLYGAQIEYKNLQGKCVNCHSRISITGMEAKEIYNYLIKSKNSNGNVTEAESGIINVVSSGNFLCSKDIDTNESDINGSGYECLIQIEQK